MTREPVYQSTDLSASRKLSLHSVEWEILDDIESMMEEEIENYIGRVKKMAQGTLEAIDNYMVIPETTIY